MKMNMDMDKKGDPASWWDEFVKNMVPVIKRVVSFSKKLPGQCCPHVACFLSHLYYEGGDEVYPDII